MSWQEYVKNPLWPILVAAVHSMVMYPQHKAYVRDFLLVEEPNINANELALKLNIALGESLVILSELRGSKIQKRKPW